MSTQTLGIAFFLMFQLQIAIPAVAPRDFPEAGVMIYGVSTIILILATLLLKNDNISFSSKAFKSLTPPILLIFLFISSMVYGQIESHTTYFYLSLLISTFLFGIIYASATTNALSLFKSISIGYALGGAILALITFQMSTTVEGRIGDTERFHPNVVSYHLAFSALSCLYLLQTNKNKALTIATLILVGIALFQLSSKTTIISLVVAISTFIFLRFRSMISGALVALLTASTLAAIYLWMNYDYISSYTIQSDGKLLLTLTGRTEIWANTIKMISSQPLFGYGFMSYREIGPQVEEISILTAHNETLNILFYAGILGMALYLATIFTTWRRINVFLTPNKGQNTPIYLYTKSILAFGLTHALAEAKLYDLNIPMALIAIIIASSYKNMPDHTPRS